MIAGSFGPYLVKTARDHGLAAWLGRGGRPGGAGVGAVAAGLVPRGVGQPAAAAGRRAGPEPGPAVAAGVEHLAGLARDTGDPDQARAVAGQVRRWARALGIGILEAGAAELC